MVSIAAGSVIWLPSASTTFPEINTGVSISGCVLSGLRVPRLGGGVLVGLVGLVPPVPPPDPGRPWARALSENRVTRRIRIKKPSRRFIGLLPAGVFAII